MSYTFSTQAMLAASHIHTTPEEFENLTIEDFCSRKLDQGNHIIVLTPFVFEKFCFENVFCPLDNEKPAFFKFLQLEGRFRKALFSRRISVTKDLTVEINLHFQFPLAWCGRGPGEQFLTWAI